MPFYVVFQIDESLCARGSMVAMEAETDEEAVVRATAAAATGLGIEVWQGARLVHRADLAGAEAMASVG